MLAGLFHGVVCAGIACQPHSVLGDRRGMSDPRASSLPKALLVGWLLQAAILVLECTPEIVKDPQVQDLLKQFSQMTGYRLFQTILKLGNSWCARRGRWIAIFTAPVVAMCDMPDMPCLPTIQVVRDLIPAFGQWHQFDHAQLVLNLYELSKFYQFAAGGMEGTFIRMHEKLPTLLHSAGNQLYTCACGCRAALSETRLRQRGLIGTLIALGTCQTYMNTVMQHARYLHPLEMWAMMGGSPKVSMGHNLRLAMAGVGQAVAPLMGLWIFAHVRKCLDLTLDFEPCNPLPVFQAYMAAVIQDCRELWPLAKPPAEVPATMEDPIEDEAPLKLITLSRPVTGEPDVEIRVSASSTGADLVAAETSLGNPVLDFQLRVDGEAVDASVPLRHMSLVSLVPADWDPQQLCAEPEVSCCLSVEDFVQYVHASDASVTGPVVVLEQLSSMRHPNMSKQEHIGILDLQGPVWGDDELLQGLLQTAWSTEPDQNVVVWDPLLISGLVQKDVPDTWTSLVSQLAPVATVVSAVLLGGHWTPLVWRVDQAESKLHTLAVTADFVPILRSLSQVVATRRGGLPASWKAHSTGFVPAGHCGALVLSFVRHLLWGWQLVTDRASLLVCAESWRKEFVQSLADPCPRPCLAGLGLPLQARLAELLVFHGVLESESVARAQAVLKALGEVGVEKALASDNPWRELKWLGNQSRPPYMLIKPTELQAQIVKRQQDQPVGHKKHKQPRPSKGKGKGATRAQISVDPSVLRLDSGIFQNEVGQPLSQLGLAQVGSAAAGVAVVSVAVIDPYLKASHPLSSGPLALFVVDAPAPPVTNFAVTTERVPLVCSANSEPLLVDGYLIQLGATLVRRAPVQPGCEVKTVPTCVVKAMIFKDQTKVPWADVVAHPLLHIFAQVPPLQKCVDEDCIGCECWHGAPDLAVDSPVLELWGKQWLRLDFSHVAPDQADLFTAHMRLPEHLQTQVQHFSGHDGVYLEPKSIDGRQPSPDFQVIWIPKADQAQLLLLRQTVANVVGMARLGTKLGLRCRTEHAAEVFAKVRPGHTFLPPGKRLTFLVGPFACGTLQSSVAQVLHANGWVAKPVQAVAAKAHIQGLMFRVQAIQDPPSKVLSMSHGDVMISREADDEAPDRLEPKVVATSATETFVSRTAEVDYIQQHDPWAKAATRLPSKTATFQIGNPLEDVTQKVVAEVMAQLPQKSHMEVDGDASVDKRVAALEQQVQDLHGQAQAIVAANQQSSMDTANQLQDIRSQIHQQGVHFEAAISSQASTIQGFHDTFQEQFRQQVSHQQTMLDSMFSKQMAQFETLLARRPRHE